MSTDLKAIMKAEPVRQNFIDVLGSEREGNAYISSVLLAVANSNALQECTPVSIIGSALRAASLRLSCDPGTGQAHLVPFKGKCTLIIGYKGLINMALRTGKYRYLNVSDIYEGMEITCDPLTGMHSLAGGKESSVVIGYLLYFELISGFRKSIYMTVDEIQEHAKKYSKSYSQGPWQTNTRDMERKTVLRMGLGKWGYFDPHDASAIGQAEAEVDEIIEAQVNEAEAMPAPEPEPLKTEKQILDELGY